MKELLKACYALARKVEKHRHDLVITCESDCWCWDADAVLSAVECELPDFQTPVTTTTDFFAKPVGGQESGEDRYAESVQKLVSDAAERLVAHGDKQEKGE